LQRALIAAPGWDELPLEMKEQIADELNVMELEDIAMAHGDLVDVTVKANFRTLGAKHGAHVQEISKAILNQSPTSLVSEIRRIGFAEISSASGNWRIELEDLVVTEAPKTGWTVASHDGESVALDLQLSPELIAAGNVREVIRFLQEARKTQGFEISDRILVKFNAHEDVVAAILNSSDAISREVLALELTHDSSLTHGHNEHGLMALLVKA